MKKDIQIPKVTGLQLAIVQEYNKDFRCFDWNTYLINNKLTPIEMVLIVSNGFDKKQQTATMRHKIQHLPAKSVAKIEYIDDSVLVLNNNFKVTFFENNQLFEKDFLIKKNTIKESLAKELSLFNGNKGFIID